jgi:hypothetical protein
MPAIRAMPRNAIRRYAATVFQRRCFARGCAAAALPRMCRGADSEVAASPAARPTTRCFARRRRRHVFYGFTRRVTPRRKFYAPTLMFDMLRRLP